MKIKGRLSFGTRLTCTEMTIRYGHHDTQTTADVTLNNEHGYEFCEWMIECAVFHFNVGSSLFCYLWTHYCIDLNALPVLSPISLSQIAITRQGHVRRCNHRRLTLAAGRRLHHLREPLRSRAPCHVSPWGIDRHVLTAGQCTFRACLLRSVPRDEKGTPLS